MLSAAHARSAGAFGTMQSHAEEGQPRDEPRPGPSIDLEREERFLQLFLAHQRQLLQFLVALVPDWSDAEDLLQETSIAIWRNLDQFEPGTDFGAWTRHIARYEVLNFRRKRGRSRVIFSDATVERLAADLAASAMGPHGDARRDALEGCLAKLSAREAELIRLRYQAGASTQAVAGRLGQSVQAVYRSLNKVHGLLLRCVRRTLATEGIHP